MLNSQNMLWLINHICNLISVMIWSTWSLNLLKEELTAVDLQGLVLDAGIYLCIWHQKEYSYPFPSPQYALKSKCHWVSRIYIICYYLRSFCTELFYILFGLALKIKKSMEIIKNSRKKKEVEAEKQRYLKKMNCERRQSNE